MRDEGISATLARIETKLDRVIQEKEDHEKRIRSLEKWKWSHALTGVSGGLLVAVAAKLGIPIPGGH